LYFEGSPPTEDPWGVLWWGEIPLYFYVPMFPGEDFLMGQIRKIQKHEERDRSGKFKNTRKGTDQENSKTLGKGQIRKIQKNKKERMEERKRRDRYNIVAWSRQDQQMQC
jgi:hypothetical protein